MENFEFENLGEIKTVGELKDILQHFDNATHFGFRNQPMQHLVIIKSDDEMFVSFQEK